MADMSPNTRIRLSVMMFLQYAFNGIWVIPVGLYLTKVGYTGMEIGFVVGTTFALGGLIAPFFVGMLADRFFSGQKVLGVLNILAAISLYLASQLAVDAQALKQPMIFFWIMLAHFLCYMPTWSLTNSIALYQMDNPGKQFPSIRVMGTFGWIAVSTIALFSKQITTAMGVEGNVEATRIPMFLGSGIGLLSGVFAFFLPSTPPKVTDQKITFADILGIKALALFKDRNFAVFAVCSFLIFLPAMFYWQFCNLFLNEIGMQKVQFKQSIGQMAEVIFLYMMPLFFARFGVKKMLLIGMLAWLGRFICFGMGEGMAPLLYIGLALHGICFDFFFVTGQLYTDKKAPKEIQAQAQGLISLITFGLGWLVGSIFAGKIIDIYAIKETVEGAEKIVGHNWQTIWIYPIVLAAMVAVLFFALFNDKTMVGQKTETEQA
ncbi:MAG: MFS transporter [Planctomycetota bacterium]